MKIVSFHEDHVYKERYFNEWYFTLYFAICYFNHNPWCFRFSLWLVINKGSKYLVRTRHSMQLTMSERWYYSNQQSIPRKNFPSPRTTYRAMLIILSMSFTHCWLQTFRSLENERKIMFSHSFVTVELCRGNRLHAKWMWMYRR